MECREANRELRLKLDADLIDLQVAPAKTFQEDDRKSGTPSTGTLGS